MCGRRFTKEVTFSIPNRMTEKKQLSERKYEVHISSYENSRLNNFV